VKKELKKSLENFSAAKEFFHDVRERRWTTKKM